MRTVLPILLCACNGGAADPDDQAPPDDSGNPTTETDDTGDPVDPPSFAADIAPLFAALCNDCHHPGSAIGYDLTNPFDPATGIVDRPNSWVVNGSIPTVIVDPGNPENSFLLTKLENAALDLHVDGNPMPYLPPLVTAPELALITDWIADGAPDDARFQDDVAPIFGTEVTLGRASGRCTWCHYPGSPTGLSVLDVFDPDEGMVGRQARTGGILVAPGDPDGSVLVDRLSGAAGAQMPLQHRRFTEDEIQTVREWIERGAPND